MLIRTRARAKSAVGPGMPVTRLGRRSIVLALLIVVICSAGVLWGLKKAYNEGTTLVAAATALGLLTEEEFTAAVKPEAMVGPPKAPPVKPMPV